MACGAVCRRLLVGEVRDEGDRLVGVRVEPHHPVVLGRVGRQVGGVEREAVDDVDAPVGAPDALELLAAGHLAGRGELVAHRGGLAVALGHRHPAHRERAAELGGGEVRDVGEHRAVVHQDGHRGERAVVVAELVRDAGAELDAPWGAPSVEEAVGAAGVLRQVDLGAGLVDGERLVGVPPERLDRARDEGVIGEDLEDVAVVLLVGPGLAVAAPGAALLGIGLLAGQPGAPGRRAAGAVGVGAGDADPLAEVVAGVVGLDDGAAAGVDGPGVVDGARDVGDPERGTGAELVVLDQVQAVARGPEHRGAVVVGRGGPLAVVELSLAGAGHDAVAEAGRQRQDAVRVGHERWEGAVRGRVGPGGWWRTRLGQRRGGAGDDEADPGGASGKETAAGNGHGYDSSRLIGGGPPSIEASGRDIDGKPVCPLRDELVNGG